MSNLAYKIQQQQRYVEQPKPSPKKMFKRKVTKGEKVLWSFALIGLLAASVLLVSTYASVYALNSDIEQLQSKIDTQTKVNSELEQKVSKLSRPERIFNIAKNDLGMTIKEDSVKVIGK
ncbi:MAG TPA: cell division protein FtsL [Bacillales bacterium]|nr:cell division protein FtsL [Bacillales bacterium]